MNAYGPWSLVTINSLVFIIFAFSFVHPKTKPDWRSVAEGDKRQIVLSILRGGQTIDVPIETVHHIVPAALLGLGCYRFYNALMLCIVSRHGRVVAIEPIQ
jgi:hypothetical protein